MPTERRALVVNLAAVNSPLRTVVSARFQLDSANVATLSDASVTGKVAQCQIAGYRSGIVGGRVTATFDNGEIAAQHFVVRVGRSDFDVDATPAGSLDITAVPA
jgi:hypothetical protein